MISRSTSEWSVGRKHGGGTKGTGTTERTQSGLTQETQHSRSRNEPWSCQYRSGLAPQGELLVPAPIRNEKVGCREYSNSFVGDTPTCRLGFYGHPHFL